MLAPLVLLLIPLMLKSPEPTVQKVVPAASGQQVPARPQVVV